MTNLLRAGLYSLLLTCLPVSAALAQAPTPMQLEMHLTYAEAGASGETVWTGHRAEVSTGRLVLGGVLGWTVGSFGGGYLGAALASDSDSGYDELGSVILGFMVGGGVGTALGVHLANHRQGKIGRNMLLTTLVQFGSLVVVAAIDNKLGTNDWSLVALPILPVTASILIERATSE